MNEYNIILWYYENVKLSSQFAYSYRYKQNTANRRGSYGSSVYNYLWNQCISPLNCEFESPSHGEVYSILHYVIKFVSDLRQVGGFLRVLRFLPPIKVTATI